MKYTEDNRGIIQNKERFKQPISFEGMKHNDISPTDIDAIIDYRNKCFILYEVKYEDAPMPRGQALALERIVKALRNSDVDAFALHCRHHVSSPRDPIVLANTEVVAFYDGTSRFWKKFEVPINTKAFTESIMSIGDCS